MIKNGIVTILVLGLFISGNAAAFISEIDSYPLNGVNVSSAVQSPCRDNEVQVIVPGNSDNTDIIDIEDIENLLREIIQIQYPELQNDILERKVRDELDTWIGLNGSVVLLDELIEDINAPVLEIERDGTVWILNYNAGGDNFLGISLLPEAQDFTKYDVLRFYIKGDTDRMRLQFDYLDKNGEENIVGDSWDGFLLTDLVPDLKVSKDGWTLVEIPIADLKEKYPDVNWNRIPYLLLDFLYKDFRGEYRKERRGIVYLKDVSFTLKPTMSLREKVILEDVIADVATPIATHVDTSWILNYSAGGGDDFLSIALLPEAQDFTKYDTLRFYIKGDTARMRLKLRYLDGSNELQFVGPKDGDLLTDLVPDLKVSKDEWTLVEIPIAGLKEKYPNVNWGRIARIGFEFLRKDFRGDYRREKKGVVSLKDISFTLNKSAFTQQELDDKLFSLGEIYARLSLVKEYLEEGEPVAIKKVVDEILGSVDEFGNFNVNQDEPDILQIVFSNQFKSLKHVTNFDYAYLQLAALNRAGYETYLVTGVDKRELYQNISAAYRGWDYITVFKDKEGRIGIMDNNGILKECGLDSGNGVYWIDGDLDGAVKKIFQENIYDMFSYNEITSDRFYEDRLKSLKNKLQELGIALTNPGRPSVYSNICQEALLTSLLRLPRRFLNNLEEVKLSSLEHITEMPGFYQEGRIMWDTSSPLDLPEDIALLKLASLFPHEATHHLDLTVWKEFDSSNGVLDLSNIFYNISWQLKQYSGRVMLRGEDSGFAYDYGKTDCCEDIATIYEVLFGDSDIYDNSRQQMEEGKFELAAKLLFAIYIMGYDRGLGSVYNYNPDSLPLTIEEVEHKMTDAQAGGIEIPATTLESFNAIKFIYYKLREKDGLEVPEYNIEISKGNFPDLYGEVSVFTQNQKEKIEDAKNDWLKALEGLSEITALANVAQSYREDIVELIKSDEVNTLFKQMLVGSLNKEEVKRLIFEKDIELNLRKVMALSLIEKENDFTLEEIVDELRSENELDLAEFIASEMTETEENPGFVDWNNIADRLILFIDQTSLNDLGITNSQSLEKQASFLTAGLMADLVSDENMLKEVRRLGLKEVNIRVRELMLYGSSRVYQAILKKMQGEDISGLAVITQDIDPDLKYQMWQELEENGELKILADFDQGIKRHRDIEDFGSFNVYDEDFTQRALDRFSRYIKYGSQGYAVAINYDVDSPNPAEVGFWMKMGDIDIKDFHYIRLHIKGDSLLGYPERLKIELKNNTGEVGEYYLNGISNNWQEFIIPLTEFKGINDLNTLTEIAFVFDKKELNKKEGRIYLDLIGLSKN